MSEERWISVEESLPHPWKDVLVAVRTSSSISGEPKFGGMQTAYLYRFADGTIKFRSDYHENEVRAYAWQPLPAPPEAS